MNWTVFWTLAIGVPVGMAILLGWLKVGMMLERFIGEEAALIVTMASIILGLAAMFGMVK